MEAYVTYCPSRREGWRGHSTKKKVRAAIRASGELGLRIFENIGDPDQGEYVEIHRDYWPEEFPA